MNGGAAEGGRGAGAWEDAVAAAALLALDPGGLGGVALRSPPGPVRERWLTLLRALMEGPVRKVPANVDPDALLGGLDVAATIAAGRPVHGRGVLAGMEGGAVVVAMAERLTPGTAAVLAQAQDDGGFAVVLLDEGLEDEAPPAALMDRVGLHIDLGGLRLAAAEAPELGGAREGLARVDAAAVMAGLCAASVALGVVSGRAPLLAVRAARAAAPWQRVRARAEGQRTLRLHRDDLRVSRRERKAGTTTIFLVDASGSSAMNRLAEAKGAVELLLADCYIRRDEVAVLAFRGQGAQLLLPPTRSLVRAKRALAGLPGGGGTPLASALDAGLGLATAVRRRGGQPSLVMLTDGTANVARDGAGGRPRARQEAEAAARLVREAGLAAILIDTSPRPNPAARTLAAAMDARYVPLPLADATALDRTIRSLGRAAGGGRG